jgi:hypothetical protein
LMGIRPLTPEEAKQVEGGPVVCPTSGQQPNGQEALTGASAGDRWHACPIATPTS